MPTADMQDGQQRRVCDRAAIKKIGEISDRPRLHSANPTEERKQNQELRIDTSCLFISCQLATFAFIRLFQRARSGRASDRRNRMERAFGGDERRQKSRCSVVKPARVFPAE